MWYSSCGCWHFRHTSSVKMGEDESSSHMASSSQAFVVDTSCMIWNSSYSGRASPVKINEPFLFLVFDAPCTLRHFLCLYGQQHDCVEAVDWSWASKHLRRRKTCTDESPTRVYRYTRPDTTRWGRFVSDNLSLMWQSTALLYLPITRWQHPWSIIPFCCFLGNISIILVA